MFVVVFVVPIGIILGVLPVTLGYALLLWRAVKRQRINKKLHVPQKIKGTITEIIKANARIQVMEHPSSESGDLWFRIDGKAFLISSDRPLPPFVIGYPIELEVN
ncbi:MAG: hypothetical protein M3421_11115 [Bacteroidota bacterium]|nr:hypothetical protein [Bacteroidota bacterium]